MTDAILDPQAAETAPYHHGSLRTALLQAAEAELVERGIERLSLRSIARRAGVSHAAPAHHFGGIDRLLTALAADGFDRFVLTQQRAMDEVPSASPVERLARAGLGYVRFAAETPALFQLIFSSERPDFSDATLAAAGDRAFHLLLDLVGDATGRDARTDPATRLKALSIWGLAHGLAHLIVAGRLREFAEVDPAMRDEMILAAMRGVMRAD